MLHYYGLDYGSTTSMLYEYADGKPMILSKIQSATKVYNGRIISIGDAAWASDTPGILVESPKREFIANHDREFSGVRCTCMIENTLTEMFRGQKQESEDRCLTLTIPNGYTASQYITMHNIVSQVIGPNAVIYLLPEPVAAALHYIHCCMKDCGNFENRHFIVCDIGGGTTDISIVTCSKKDHSLQFEVEPNQKFKVQLGGNDFNIRLCRKLGYDERTASVETKKAIQILKHRLSNHEMDSVSVSNEQYTCSRKDFEESISKELAKLGELLDDLRNDYGQEINNSWTILRVGGSCRIPAIQKLLQNKFPEIKQTFDTEPNDIFYSVAQGAAVYSAFKAGALKGEYESIDIKNATPHKISYMNSDEEWKTIVPQNSKDDTYVSPELHLIGGEDFKDGTYSVGPIMLWEEGAAPMDWPRDKERRFNLGNRTIKDVKLQLSIEIINSRMYSCSITDLLTKEQNTWVIDNFARQQ